jgi:heme oxygenase
MELLRERTAASHARVERSVDVKTRCRTVDAYREWLGRLLGFYRPFEAMLGGFDWSTVALNYPLRIKAGWLEADLLALGMTESEINGLPNCQRLPRPENLAGAIGCLYVLEGATLGGQIISRLVNQELSIGDDNGGRFYAAYGARVGMMWRAFRDAASSYCGDHPDRLRASAENAVETFEALESWVLGNPASRR